MGSLPGRRQNRQVGNGNADHENAYSALPLLAKNQEGFRLRNG